MICDLMRKNSRGFLCATIGPCAFALAFLLIFSVLESSYWKSRISQEAAARASARYRTSGSLHFFVEFGDSVKFEKNSSEILESARSYRSNSSEKCSENVASFSDMRQNDAQATLTAKDALALLDELEESDDPGVVAALQFLSELDDDCTESDEVFLAIMPGEGNPLDRLGTFVATDLVASDALQAASRLCMASSRIFFLLTLGIFLCFPEVDWACGSVLESVWDLAGIARSLRMFIERLQAVLASFVPNDAFHFPFLFSRATSRSNELLALDSVRLLI